MAPRTLAVALLLASAALLAGCAGSRPWPPCPKDWVEQPLEHICLHATGTAAETCTAAAEAGATRQVECRAASDDGSVALAYSLQNGGSARIRAVDGQGIVQYDQTIASSRSGTLPLTGAAGTWTLQVDFQDAGVLAQAILYG